MRIIVLIAIVGLGGCDPGPLPEVPRPYHEQKEKVDYKKYWFATDSARPLPLDHAIQSGDLVAVRRLLEQGAHANSRWGESGDRFPLQEVIEAPNLGYRISDPVEAISLLLKHGADPNARWCMDETRDPSKWRRICTAERGTTPLIFAAFAGERSIVERLLEAGADPHSRDFTGRSALDYASDAVVFETLSRALFPDLATRDREALEWLKRAGGSSYDPSRNGTPLLRALVSDDAGHYVFRSAVESEDRMLARVRILLRIGADPNERVRVRSPLSLALDNHTFRVARELLRGGANVNERWCELFIPRWASSVSSPQHLLVHQGEPHQDPACSASNGITPLMWIAGAGDREAVELLLEFNADKSLKDWAGRSALDYATSPDIRKLLLN